MASPAKSLTFLWFDAQAFGTVAKACGGSEVVLRFDGDLHMKHDPQFTIRLLGWQIEAQGAVGVVGVVAALALLSFIVPFVAMHAASLIF
jgi:hypothetical protein